MRPEYVPLHCAAVVVRHVAVSVTVLGTEPQDLKDDGETDNPILLELTDAIRLMPKVVGLQVKESLVLPLLVGVVAVKLIVVGSDAQVTLGCELVE